MTNTQTFAESLEKLHEKTENTSHVSKHSNVEECKIEYLQNAVTGHSWSKMHVAEQQQVKGATRISFTCWKPQCSRTKKNELVVYLTGLKWFLQYITHIISLPQRHCTQDTQDNES